MYKNLNPSALGVSGRQSELIELAMTYGFRGFEIRFGEMARRAKVNGIEQVCRFIASAKIRVGGFPLPVNWEGKEATFKSDLADLPWIAEVAASVDAKRCFTMAMPGGTDLPYHEAFELHRQRFAEVGDALEPFGIRLGIGLEAAAEHRAKDATQYICQTEALLTLIKTIGSPQVGLMLDSWNWAVGGGGSDQLSELTKDQIVSVRLADAPGDTAVSELNEKQRLLPGEAGTVDCVAILAHLGQVDYDGPVSVNPHPSRFSGMTREAIVQKASNVLDEQWRAAGLNKAGKLAPAIVEG